MKLHILENPKRNPLQPIQTDWYPLYSNRQELNARGITYRFFTGLSPEIYQCDVLCISSRFFALHVKSPSEHAKALEQLASIKEKVDRIVWFDFRDSTGNTQFEVLPFVDRYLKKQLLKDLSLYQKSFYGNRIYTDFIHQNFGVKDNYNDRNLPLNLQHRHKLGISWSPGLLDFRGGTKPKMIWQLLTDYFSTLTNNYHPFNWKSPKAPRHLNLLATFNPKYDRDTVAWQRRHVASILTHLSHQSKIVSHVDSLTAEINARRNTKIVLSLFGWGELCSRDFQTFIAGSALIAPDTSHLVTWPETHIPHKTYHPIKWDLTDLPEAYEELVDNDDKRITLATNGQRTYQKVWSKQGRSEFCTHFISSLAEDNSVK